MTADRLAMRSVRSPFPMRVIYGHRDTGAGSTEVSVRVEGDAGRFYALVRPLLGLAVRRSITRDLRNLKQELEGSRRPPSPRTIAKSVTAKTGRSSPPGTSNTSGTAALDRSRASGRVN